MRILAVSHAYAPCIGGVETVTRVLTDEWLRLGHEVQIVTNTAGHAPGQPCPVHRRPDKETIRRLHVWADVVWHNKLSVKYAPPAILLRRRKPWFVTHQTIFRLKGGRVSTITRRLLFRLARNIAITRFVAGTFGAPSVVVPNPFDHRRFRRIPSAEGRGDAVFLGRLVREKGADLAIEACRIAREAGWPWRLSIVGQGREDESLRRQVAQSGLEDWVRFAGALQGESLAEELNGHKTMVVPSRWDEPFGVVALEGAACGLVVVGPNHGGLPEAIGPCGPSLPIGEPSAWASTVALLCRDAEARRPFLEAAPKHLEIHTAESIARRYLDMFQQALSERRSAHTLA